MKKTKQPPKAMIDEMHALLKKHRWTTSKKLSPKALSSMLTNALSATTAQNCWWEKQEDGSYKLRCE